MSKIKLKEIADVIREKDGTTEPIIANDFATRIRNLASSEDLDTELTTQDELLDELEDTINAFPNLPDPNEWQPNPTWWDIEKILEEDTRDYPVKAIMLLYANDVKDTFNYNADAYLTSDGAFYELDTVVRTVTHTWDLTKDKPCLADGVEQYKTRYVIAYYKANTNVVLYENINVIYLTTKSEGKITSVKNGAFKDNYILESIKNYNTSGITKFSGFFSSCHSLKKPPQLDTSSGTNFTQMFYRCSSLRTIPQLNTSSGTEFNNMFYNCYCLRTIPLIDTSKGTNFVGMFDSCHSLQTIPLLDTSKGTNLNRIFYECYSLQTISQLSTGNATDLGSAFQLCSKLQTIPPLDTKKCKNFSDMFRGCSSLKTIPLINLISATSVSNLVNGCKALENLTLKNIKITIQIGSGTSYGHLLTLDSLLNTIKELWDNSTGSSTLTLTVGSSNLTKLANVYVKLVDITDEMRAEDEYIDNKKPFVVCESTDEGAMLITEYVTSKNWQLA